LKHFVPVVALLAAGCGLGSPTSTNPPLTTPTPVEAASTATPAPTPAATACRLPVAGGDAPTDGNAGHGAKGHGGFLQWPGATFAADPASLGAYVLGAGKWVPVQRAWVSPDGKSYAYPEYRNVGGPATGIIHVVDIASGADRPLGVPAPSMPVSWEAAGIYIARVVPNSDARPQGLSLLDPVSGSLRQITASGTWTLIGGAAAYGSDLDTTITPPPGGAGPGAGNRVSMLKLDTGQASVVGTYPATNVALLGVQGSSLLLGLTTADRYSVKLGSSVLYDGSVTAPQPSGPAVLDGNTIWLSGNGAVWRSVNGGTAERLTVAGMQLSVVAGACR
jgi:hypothetical protein